MARIPSSLSSDSNNSDDVNDNSVDDDNVIVQAFKLHAGVAKGYF
jgi:hypothetical protein